MNKDQRFQRLVEDVSNCRICENMLSVPYLENAERLINCGHEAGGGNVNLWNLWQGSLVAEIMVIGQDFGTVEDADTLVKKWRSGEYKDSPTDHNLKMLFWEVFGIDIDKPDKRLFFTNTANCYRQNRTSGSMHCGWLPICANKFMYRLIDIIRPEKIIVLGEKAFEAMQCLDKAKLICRDVSHKKQKDTFAEVIEHHYTLQSEDWCVPVYPVYHPGAFSMKNRPLEKQIEDWKKIAKEIKK